MTGTIDIKQQARELLATLGLALRIDDEEAARIDIDTWREIASLAHLVNECVTFQEPARTGLVYPWLRIGLLRTTPNVGGYCTSTAVDPVYWMRKTDISKLASWRTT